MTDSTDTLAHFLQEKDTFIHEALQANLKQTPQVDNNASAPASVDSTRTYGRHLVTRAELTRGDHVFSIPISLCITEDTLRRDPIVSQCFKYSAKLFSLHTIWAIYLALNDKNDDDDDDESESVIPSYIKTLPRLPRDFPCHPLLMKEQEVSITSLISLISHIIHLYILKLSCSHSHVSIQSFLLFLFLSLSLSIYIYINVYMC